MKPIIQTANLRKAIGTAFLAFALQICGTGQLAAQETLPRVAAGYELPAGLEISAARGTGRTTGHIADLTVRNNSDQPVELPPAMFYLPSDGKHQGYVARPVPGHVIAPGAVANVPVDGYCSSVHRPPIPAGEAIPPLEDWIVATGESGPVEIPAVDDPMAPGQALVPGTDTPMPRAVSLDDEPMTAVPLLFAAITEIERVTVELQEDGELRTPFSSNPDREREAVNQQTFWLFVSELENEPYTREDFTQRLEAQYEDRTGIPVAEASDEDRERLEQGADDFWDAFELVGAEAKVINVAPGVSTAGAAAQGEAKAADEPRLKAGELGAKGTTESKGTTEVVEAPCKVIEDITHTPPIVQVTVADSYGDAESRAKISAGIRKAVESTGDSYVADTPPSTAYAIWRHDHIGGISSGYADTVFLEQNNQDWVWSTDPMSTTASGDGKHTLAFQPGPGCTAVVAGAASMWIKASSEAFDPLERSIEHFRALDAVKEATVKYLAGKLPPGLDDALEAGVEAITDPSSDTYAAANGRAVLTVGNRTASDASESRVVYKREDKEDKAIVGGGETIKTIKASDVKPNSLTSHINATSRLEAGAEGNGFAKASLESLYGTILIGVCECPSGRMHQVLTDNGQLIQSQGAQAAVERAKKEMQQAAERIDREIKSGAQKTDGESLKRRAEGELGAWGKSIGGDRFEPKPGESAQTPSQQ